MAAPAVLAQNAPRPDDFLTVRGEKLYVRIFLPATEVQAVVLFIHGLGGHANSVSKMAFGRDLAAAGYAVVVPDLIGHGHSEGERCYIRTHQFYLADLLQLLDALLVPASDGSAAAAAAVRAAETAAETADGAPAAGTPASDMPASDHLSSLTAEQRKLMQSAPFFVSGESMGGGLSLLLAMALKQRNDALVPRFMGLMLLAPAIKAFPPPAPVVFLLRHLVVPFVPLREVPNFLESVHRPELGWKTAETIAAVAADAWGKPGGLGYGHNMKFGMGLAMLDMIAYLRAHLGDIDCPFLVMHDPTDGIVSFEGTKMLLAAAKTPEEDRRLVEMPGELHDLLCNNYAGVVASMLDWVKVRMAAATAAAAGANGSNGA